MGRLAILQDENVAAGYGQVTLPSSHKKNTNTYKYSLWDLVGAIHDLHIYMYGECFHAGPGLGNCIMAANGLKPFFREHRVETGYNLEAIWGA